ncbi:hypothetical protein DSO57_1016731 [Entomophthora muscae]|uniref:Uncharacterized protein n=1 Tax=Entomophthora muscae TaxID=34485 RepID=A0ACC2RW31_9FUNG|nr:hypothetical protein DSO57_1016731 [Entomophthora muscae]
MSPFNMVTSPWSFLPFNSRGRSSVFDNGMIDQTIQLTLRALDEDCRGETDVAVDMYFEALTCMLNALPLGHDAKKNKLLQHKFSTIMTKKFESMCCSQFGRITSDPSLSSLSAAQGSNAGSVTVQEIDPNSSGPQSSLSNKIVSAAVAGAVAFKQSPIPDILYSTFTFTAKKAQAIYKYIGVQSLCWEVSKVGLNKAIELDAQYNLHEKASAALMTSAIAFIKAGIAYKEASSYQDLKQRTDV